ncbi:hypothetical protein FSARC_14564 [Fusarium sarcochroum]|uniref:Uncharacterized protein n=1 Tax=Fusarium sarcochroum TaxID=1208366 RepID=A0A8H4SSV4_9HYPO|nr:hypothetical protein FSARC_14564 [Fusarium sarcochroum]
MAPASASALSLWSRTVYIPQSKPVDVIWTLFNLTTIAVLAIFISYMSTKLFIYIFLVEKVHIIQSNSKPRMKSRLYLFNSFGMISIFLVVVVLNFVYRYSRIENGQCIIGMRNISLLPLLLVDVVINIYLTILFLLPLKSLYSFSKSLPKSQTHLRLRNAALRTFVGSCCTLLSSVANMTLIIYMGGEPGWMCLMCCNIDILFSAVVIYWVTSRDNASNDTQSRSDGYQSSDRRYGTRTFTSEVRTGAPIFGSPTGTVAEVALVASNTHHSEPDSRSAASDCNSGPGSGIIVTTTIQRQSRSGSFGSDMGDISGVGSRIPNKELACGFLPR